MSVTKVEKPWGYELHWAKTDRYVGKLIHVNAGHALSLQYHNQKDETIFLSAGRMLFEIAARRRRIPVSLCGEMASDPAILTLLVGLGLSEFSMTPGAIPVAKQVLAELRSDELRTLARRVLKLATIDDIERVLLAALGRLTLIKGVTS